MESRHHAAADLATLGREWIAAWNSHDLERVLALYAEDSEMTSDKIPVFGFDPSGTLRGKDGIRGLLGHGLEAAPQFAFRSDRYLCKPRQHRRVLSERARRQDLRISAA